jgi:hypothetical protein
MMGMSLRETGAILNTLRPVLAAEGDNDERAAILLSLGLWSTKHAQLMAKK